MEMGADNIEKQKLLKENKDKYCKRQEFIKKSYMITDDMALCVMDTNKYMRYELALNSEELLQFDDVEASFTIGYINNDTVGVSARSIGKIDVENIMRKLDIKFYGIPIYLELRDYLKIRQPCLLVKQVLVKVLYSIN